jgi:hypothetical protein
MARYNEILVGRYNRAMQKLLQMKGEASLVTLSEEISPTFTLFYGAENRYLEGWDRFATILNQPAVAANQSVVRLRNPATSNAVAVIEKAKGISLVADQPIFGIGITALDLATVVAMTGSKLDPRGRPNPALFLSRQATTAAAPALDTNIDQVVYPATGGSQDFITFEDQEVPLLPGMAVQIFSNTVNAGLTVSYIWRERFLEEAERT